MTRPAIHWFRNDLRLSDNGALAAAARQPLITVFILDDAVAAPWERGGASRWWLHHSLTSLARDLEARGGRLILRRGDTLDILRELIESTNAQALYWTRCYEPWAARLETQVHDALAEIVEIHRRGGNLLFEPEVLRTGDDRPFKVFTPFYKSLLKQPEQPDPLAPPAKIDSVAQSPAGDHIDEWALLPKRPDWAGGLREAWKPGEAGAATALERFIDSAVTTYKNDRDRPDLPGTSRLSPHLHFGEISPRQIWHAIRFASQLRADAISGGDAYLRELVWRDFSYHLLHHWPDFPSEPFRANFRDFPWAGDEAALTAWQKGQTGYPIVDAGMRELWHTGWMHNRVRMIAASLLVKHLLIPWQQGEKWFWDTLVDADLANNSASWQWVAGCGADAAPYFRIFNPIIQGKKFDPDGAYVRRWVPELADVPTKYIHEPWAMPADIADGIDFDPGISYPEPVVEHSFARQRALAAFETIKQAS